MLWNPRVGIEGAQESGVDNLRHWVEPLYTVPLFALAIVGLFFVPSAFRALAVIYVFYETAAAWVFAGTTRYRVSWDFVLGAARGRGAGRDLAPATRACARSVRRGRRAARCRRREPGVTAGAPARGRPRSSRA